MKKKTLPIGNDNFRDIRENNKYYVDKTLMIQDFLETNDTVALVTRPRRFGKTLNMTMLREFFDITADSKGIFEGLAIMDTEYAEKINSRPVIYLTFKDCNAQNPVEMAIKLCRAMFSEFDKYNQIMLAGNYNIRRGVILTKLVDEMMYEKASLTTLSGSLALLLEVVHEMYKVKPILLLDEYDTPIMSSYTYQYHDEVLGFISDFYGSSLKGQEHMSQALLTGIQRVAKESIFSKLNNIKVYSVLSKRYAPYFGLTVDETSKILSDYDLSLNDDVKMMYDGYRIGGYDIYNPWSVLYYIDEQVLKPYWVNTSTNTLIYKCIDSFRIDNRKEFDRLLKNGKTEVSLVLETAYSELKSQETLWGLFVNAGYLTVLDQKNAHMMVVSIPNQEVKEEFQRIITRQIGIEDSSFYVMIDALANADYHTFTEYYKSIVLNCTSYYDSIKNAGQYENPYHMLTLGMVISLDYLYDIKSNYEAGDGRADIRMVSKQPEERAHIIMEFKQDKDVEKASDEALQQIFDKHYADDLSGKILCMGIAHNKKNCQIKVKELS